MSNRWNMDYSWQYGHNPHEFFYDLQADFAPPVAEAVFRKLLELQSDPAADDGLVGFGGAVAELLAPGRITATSHGEDACDSLSYLADLIADQAEQVDPRVRVTWTQLPPIGDDGAAAVRRDGYWIPADEHAGYEARRDRVVERLREVTGDVVDQVTIEIDDGFAVAVGRRRDVVVFSLGLGATQLDMMESADADGQLRAYAL